MEEVILFIESNPTFLNVVELVLRLFLVVISILIYRRTGKVVSFNKQPTQSNPVSVEELTEFGISLRATCDKIDEIQARSAKK